ncbi:MAG: DUF4837 family protein [Bacteroidales bacterium]|nr:DUF4837 family protein [Bacteroidales bacterium]
MKQYIAYIFICTLLFTACKGGFGGTSMTGEPGDLLVVINDEYKNSEVGEKVNEILSEEDFGLTQSEAPFSVVLISRNNFTKTFRSFRNILYLEVDKKYTKSQIKYKKDLWAQHQAFASLSVPNSEELLAILEARHDNLIEYFVQSEIERYQQLYRQAKNQIVEQAVYDNLGVYISIPEGYGVNKIADNFMWISLESKAHSQGLLIYKRPYTDTAQFNKTSLLNYRDSVTKAHIPGPTDGSYMTTEYVIPIRQDIGKFVNDDYTVQLRGRWRVENDFMAGPFTSYSFCNPEKNTIVTIEGYVYYPNKEKRNFMRQLQAICRSAHFTKQQIEK